MRNARKIGTKCAMYCLVLTVAGIITSHFNPTRRAAVISDPRNVVPAVSPSSMPRATTRGHIQKDQPEIDMQAIDEHPGMADRPNQPRRPGNQFDTDLLAAMHELMTVQPHPGVRP